MTVDEQQTHILVECPELISSVRVGVLEILWYLEKQNLCKVQFKCTKDITKQDLLWCDVFVCVRGCEYATKKIVEAAKKNNRYIIYFLDDDLLNVPDDISCSDYFNSSLIRKNMIEILKMSDILWVVNPYIAEKYCCYCPKYHIGRVPIQMGDVDIEKRKEKSVIRFLYAGSIDHEGIIQKYLKPAIQKICDEYGNQVEFTFIGANPHISNRANVRYLPYFDKYDEYKIFVNSGEFHYGFALVLEDDFYKGKYYNKYLEYGAIGVIGIYSKTEPYTFVIEDGVNGYYVDSNSDTAWYKTIKHVLDMHHNYEKLFQQIESEIKLSFDYMSIGEQLKENIPQVYSFKAKKISTRDIKLLPAQILFFYSRICFLFKQHKLLAIPLIIQKVIKKCIKYVYRFLKGI